MPKPHELINPAQSASSQTVKQRINKARKRQLERFRDLRIFFNSQMNHRQTRKFCLLDAEGEELLEMAINELNMSARAYDKILKVSRTIADLDQNDQIQAGHIAEAIQYRSLDRNLWL